MPIPPLPPFSGIDLGNFQGFRGKARGHGNFIRCEFRCNNGAIGYMQRNAGGGAGRLILQDIGTRDRYGYADLPLDSGRYQRLLAPAADAASTSAVYWSAGSNSLGRKPNERWISGLTSRPFRTFKGAGGNHRDSPTRGIRGGAEGRRKISAANCHLMLRSYGEDQSTRLLRSRKPSAAEVHRWTRMPAMIEKGGAGARLLGLLAPGASAIGTSSVGEKVPKVSYFALSRLLMVAKASTESLKR